MFLISVLSYTRPTLCRKAAIKTLEPAEYRQNWQWQTPSQWQWHSTEIVIGRNRQKLLGVTSGLLLKLGIGLVFLA